MDILQLIDRLEELFNESKNVPFTKNVMVDEDRMLDIIDQMRIAIPEEVKKAQQLLGQRGPGACSGAGGGEPHPRARPPKSRPDGDKGYCRCRKVQRRSDLLLVQARSEAENIRADADDYVMDNLPQLQTELERIRTRCATESARSRRKQTGRAAPSSMSEPADK